MALKEDVVNRCDDRTGRPHRSQIVGAEQDVDPALSRLPRQRGLGPEHAARSADNPAGIEWTAKGLRRPGGTKERVVVVGKIGLERLHRLPDEPPDPERVGHATIDFDADVHADYSPARGERMLLTTSSSIGVLCHPACWAPGMAVLMSNTLLKGTG
jgi:hypothetical protein